MSTYYFNTPEERKAYERALPPGVPAKRYWWYRLAGKLASIVAPINTIG
jgi:hypothetical protein